AGSQYADQHIVPAQRGDWNILKHEAGLSSRLDQRFHSAPGRSLCLATAAFRPGPTRCATLAQPYLPGAGSLSVTIGRPVDERGEFGDAVVKGLASHSRGPPCPRAPPPPPPAPHHAP